MAIVKFAGMEIDLVAPDGRFLDIALAPVGQAGAGGGPGFVEFR